MKCSQQSGPDCQENKWIKKTFLLYFAFFDQEKALDSVDIVVVTNAVCQQDARES